MSHYRSVVVVAALALVSIDAPANAQTIGTFRWQLQPFCNVLTLNVTQQGSIYTLDGTDRCGGSNQPSSAAGIASLTPNGLVSFGITTVGPNGTPIHTEATIDLASLNGTWRDSSGNSGSLVFTPGASAGGAPRPIPSGGVAPASITNMQIANNAVTGDNIVNGSITIADLAAPPSAAFASGKQFLFLSITEVIVRSVSLTVPAAGRVIVNACGFFDFGSIATGELAFCSITTGTIATPVDLTMFAWEQTATAMWRVPFAGTRGFAAAAGTHTFNLVCSGSSTAAVGDTSLTAMFFPGS